jgi:hypothetical protein
MTTHDSRPGRARARWNLSAFLLIGLAIAGLAWVATRPESATSGASETIDKPVTAVRTASAGEVPFEPAPPAVATPVRGNPGPKFCVPVPGDPEYADYQEMLGHPRYRSSLENASGYALPYDPEWRSVVAGRREAPPTDLELTDGAGSITRLVEELLRGLENEDEGLLQSLRVNREEYQLLLWVEFPQSRPYARIPADEAWMFQLTTLRDGMGSLFGVYGRKPWDLVGTTVASVVPFTNFTLHRGIEILVADAKTGERLILNRELTVVERNGRFKILSFTN